MPYALVPVEGATDFGAASTRTAPRANATLLMTIVAIPCV